MSTLEDVRAARAHLQAWYDQQNKPSGLELGLTNWTYAGDRHVEAVERLPVVFIGFNPGGGNGATVNGMSRSERAWRTRCSRLAGVTPDRIVFAELISIPTHDQAGLEADDSRLESLMQASLASNLATIAFHRPQIIFQTGITGRHRGLVRRLYGLSPIGPPVARTPPREGTLLHHSRTPAGTDWIAFRHFASPGFSSEDRGSVQAHALGLGWDPAVDPSPLPTR